MGVNMMDLLLNTLRVLGVTVAVGIVIFVVIITFTFIWLTIKTVVKHLKD